MYQKKNKLSGVQSREESPPGDLFVCQQVIKWFRHGYRALNVIADTKIMFLGQVEGKLWPKT